MRGWDQYNEALYKLIGREVQVVIVNDAPGIGAFTHACDYFKEADVEFVDFRVVERTIDCAKRDALACKKNDTILVLSDFGFRFFEQPTNQDKIIEILEVGARTVLITHERPYSPVIDMGVYVDLPFPWGPPGVSWHEIKVTEEDRLGWLQKQIPGWDNLSQELRDHVLEVAREQGMRAAIHEELIRRHTRTAS